MMTDSKPTLWLIEGCPNVPPRIALSLVPVVVGGKVICHPVIREPHGIRDKFNIGAHDMDDARALGAALREGCAIPSLRIV